ncbi:MAG TPA: hypothetical protein VMW42_05635, partial [Desulfatiglandales bacterium]|nr:hypothetical protein [Desulfatiglandales bacterium]
FLKPVGKWVLPRRECQNGQTPGYNRKNITERTIEKQEHEILTENENVSLSLLIPEISRD